MNYEHLLTSLKERAPSWSATQEQILLEPYEYLISIPGKEVRSALIDAFNVWLQVPGENLAMIKRIVQMLHTASLMMDDVEDNSLLRRGIPVAHKIYGVPITINSANYAYFLAYQHMFHVIPSERISAINDELLDLHRGQGIELYWREHLHCPTEEEYVSMVNNKTGGLFRIAIKLMQGSATAQSTSDYLPLVNLIGILFQIRDDYQNLQSDQYSANKGYCEDLTEGKFSFPVIHSIRADRTNTRLLNVLRQRPTDVETKSWAVEYLKETGSFEYTKSVLATLDRQCRQEIDRLGGNTALLGILDKLGA